MHEASAGMNAAETFANVYEESNRRPCIGSRHRHRGGALDAFGSDVYSQKVLPDNMAEPFKEGMLDRLLRNKGMVKRAFIGKGSHRRY